MLAPLILLFAILQSSALALQQPPVLECLESGMRLHFPPDMGPDPATGVIAPRQFCGHVYVKGYFFTRQCHLDYTEIPIAEPFYFHIPYHQGECQVRRERTNENSVPGVAYSTVVVVQHHKLFLTNNDHAYSLSCYYQDNRHRVDQRVEISDLTTQPLAGLDATPNCTYVVLRNGSNGAEPVADGESVRFANIGDALVHRWQCASSIGEELGMLVHSCYVRDGVGSEFALVDDRGCVTDTELMGQLAYSEVEGGGIDTAPIPREIRNQAESSVNAFKFADQMIVYFSCQVTLCERANQGCEGITPPICVFTSSTSTTTTTTTTTTTPEPTTTTTEEETTPVAEVEVTTPAEEATTPVEVEGAPVEVPVLMRNPEGHAAGASTRQYAANSRYGSHQESKWIDLYLPGTKATSRPTGVANVSAIDTPSSLVQFNLFGGGARRAPENLFAVRQASGIAVRRRRSFAAPNKTRPRSLTVDVVTERMFVFTKDDGLAETHKESRTESSTANQHQSWTSVKCTGQIECSSSCSYIQPGWIAAFIVLFILSASAVMFQRGHYQRRLNAACLDSESLSPAARLSKGMGPNQDCYSPYTVPSSNGWITDHGRCAP